MKAIIINGSPKGIKSNTIKIANAFSKGLSTGTNWDIEQISIRNSKIEHCTGCFSCWTKTPGMCIIKDDMSIYIEKYLEADLIIWSIPLYYYGMPSKSKAFLDRLLPLNLPFMKKRKDGGIGHPSRYDMSNKKYVLISSCGFSSRENNYEALTKQFDIMYGEKYEKILCPEGELLSVPELKKKINLYLELVETAGIEYGNNFKIEDETYIQLQNLLLPPETFEKMADAHWEILDSSNTNSSDISYPFMKQMQAIFNPYNAKDLDTVIEIEFLDIQKSYQFIIKNGTCTLEQGTTEKYTTKIETPFSIWKDISSGEIDGTQALVEGKYRVVGDFNIIMEFDSIFSTVQNS